MRTGGTLNISHGGISLITNSSCAKTGIKLQMVTSNETEEGKGLCGCASINIHQPLFPPDFSIKAAMGFRVHTPWTQTPISLSIMMAFLQVLDKWRLEPTGPCAWKEKKVIARSKPHWTLWRERERRLPFVVFFFYYFSIQLSSHPPHSAFFFKHKEFCLGPIPLHPSLHLSSPTHPPMVRNSPCHH